MKFSLNLSSAKRCNNDDLPTPESPIIMNLKR